MRLFEKKSRIQKLLCEVIQIKSYSFSLRASYDPESSACLPEPSVQISEATSEAVSTILAESLNLLRRPIDSDRIPHDVNP